MNSRAFTGSLFALAIVLLSGLWGTAKIQAAAAAAPVTTPTVASPTSDTAAWASSLVAQAAQAEDQGHFAKAAHLYESAVQAGVVNGDLYYNLGINYFRAGKLGDAVAAFLAARRYLPRDPDVAANLHFSLQRIHDRLDANAPLSPAARVAQVLVGHVTLRELAWATSLTAALAGILLCLSLWVKVLAPLRRTALWGLLLPCVLGAGLVAKQLTDVPWGAVDQAEAKVYSGPGTMNTVVFELKEGAPVEVTGGGHSGFYKIELSDGKQGWIAASQVKVLVPI